MYRFAFVVIFFLGLAIQSVAQDELAFVFDSNPRALDVSSISSIEMRDHPLGEEIALKLELLKTRYTYIEAAGPTSPVDKTIIIKPVIYNSILKLNRFYKSELKDENISYSDAQKEFLSCLNVALIIYAENTDEFEQYLRKSREPGEIVSVFNKVSFR